MYWYVKIYLSNREQIVKINTQDLRKEVERFSESAHERELES